MYVVMGSKIVRELQAFREMVFFRLLFSGYLCVQPLLHAAVNFAALFTLSPVSLLLVLKLY